MNPDDLQQKWLRSLPDYLKGLRVGFHDAGFSLDQSFELVKIFLSTHTTTKIIHDHREDWNRE